MNKYLMLLPAVGCLLGFAACSNAAEQSDAETTAPAATTASTVTTVTTMTETTTVTTTTTVDYQIAENASLEADIASARPTSCTFTLSNQGEENLTYTHGFRIYRMDTGQLLNENSHAETEPDLKARSLAPGESTEIEADWTDLYGVLEDGSYLFELELSREELDDDTQDSDSSASDSDAEHAETTEPFVIRNVVCALFEINSEGFAPRLSIAPETVKPDGCVLTIQNAPDAVRDYGLVYRLYDETDGKHEQLFRQLDMDAKLDKNYHMEPGQMLTLKFNWNDIYGSLLEGDYVIEVDILTEGEEEAIPYRVPFTIS